MGAQAGAELLLGIPFTSLCFQERPAYRSLQLRSRARPVPASLLSQRWGRASKVFPRRLDRRPLQGVPHPLGVPSTQGALVEHKPILPQPLGQGPHGQC